MFELLVALAAARDTPAPRTHPPPRLVRAFGARVLMDARLLRRARSGSAFARRVVGHVLVAFASLVLPLASFRQRAG